jgi:hypothetical protein
MTRCGKVAFHVICAGGTKSTRILVAGKVSKILACIHNEFHSRFSGNRNTTTFLKLFSTLFIQSSASNIYLNLTTNEEKCFTIELTCQGFRVASESHDNIGEGVEDSDDIFETPYALLNTISPGFGEEGLQN